MAQVEQLFPIRTHRESPLSTDPAEMRDHLEAMNDPSRASLVDASLNTMYSSSIKEMGLSPEDIDIKTEQFQNRPLDEQKVKTAFECRRAAFTLIRARMPYSGL